MLCDILDCQEVVQRTLYTLCNPYIPDCIRHNRKALCDDDHMLKCEIGHNAGLVLSFSFLHVVITCYGNAEQSMTEIERFISSS